MQFWKPQGLPGPAMCRKQLALWANEATLLQRRRRIRCVITFQQLVGCLGRTGEVRMAHCKTAQSLRCTGCEEHKKQQEHGSPWVHLPAGNLQSPLHIT